MNTLSLLLQRTFNSLFLSWKLAIVKADLDLVQKVSALIAHPDKVNWVWHYILSIVVTLSMDHQKWLLYSREVTCYCTDWIVHYIGHFAGCYIHAELTQLTMYFKLVRTAPIFSHHGQPWTSATPRSCMALKHSSIVSCLLLSETQLLCLSHATTTVARPYRAAASHSVCIDYRIVIIYWKQ